MEIKKDDSLEEEEFDDEEELEDDDQPLKNKMAENEEDLNKLFENEDSDVDLNEGCD